MPRLLAPLLRNSLLSKRVSAGVASSLLVSLSFSAWSWSWPSRGFSDLRSLAERKTFTRKPWLRLAFNDYYFRMSQMPMQHQIHCCDKTCSKISKTLVFYSIMTRGLMMMHAGRQRSKFFLEKLESCPSQSIRIFEVSQQVVT